MSGFFILRQSDEALKETLKESSKDAAQAQLASLSSNWIAEVSHELRLPIANIRLLVETLLDGALEDPEVCRRMLKRAYRETDRLQALVVDLLSLERIAQTHQDNNCKTMSFLARAQYAKETVNKQAMEKDVEIRLNVVPDFEIYANAEQLDQVLLNLVENAVKFTGAGGVVTISSLDSPGKFSVSDTGIGMPAIEIPKIFQRFYRIDRSQSRGSSGLGLSIVKNIADLHGAKIEVESAEGKGSVFTLEFPHGPKPASEFEQ
jgi:two-component system, OmpR family, phosphate regulon sensor histidine kinase PhoR